VGGVKAPQCNTLALAFCHTRGYWCHLLKLRHLLWFPKYAPDITHDSGNL